MTEKSDIAMKKSATVTRPSDTEVMITRMFNAPRALVWQAMTDPKAIPHWWGPRRYETIVDKMDVRPGGQWRFVHRGEDGSEHAFVGEYREITPIERLVQTFAYEPFAQHVSVETMTLEDLGEQTRMTVVADYGTRENRDAAYAVGMEEGMQETYRRLDEYLAELAR
jgi:uncharacterized protein YndB with AHSA1/START domain